MPDPLPRWVIALTVLVAVVAISVGIKDYFQQQKNVAPPASTATAADSKAKNRPKKTSSTKTRQARRPASETTVSATTRSDADNIETPLTAQFPKAGANATLSMDGGPNNVIVQAAQREREVEAATDGEGRIGNEFSATGLSACLPLPNMTKPGDIDAPYYENWAKEYCGH